MGKLGRTRAVGSVAGVMAVLLSSAAHAELQAMLEAGVGHSDNIVRAEVDEVEETIGTIGLQLDWLERTRRIDGEATVDLSYYEYLDNTFESEVVGTANGSLAVAILPERLQWIFEDSFGQAQDDPFAPATPETREDLNYFSTGPDLTVRFGSAGFTRLFGRWSSTTYETSPLDATRTTGGIAFGRRSSPRSELSLNGIAESIDFDSDLNADYDRKSAFISWRVDASRTLLTTEVGYTWLDRDGSDDTTGSALVNIVVTRDLSASSALLLTLGSQLGDTGDSLRSALTGNVVGVGSQITATADPFENRVVSLEYRFRRSRTGFALGASYNDDEYQTQTQFDRTRYVYNAAFSRRLTGTLELELGAALNSEDFVNTGIETDELRFDAGLNWRAFRTLGFRFLVERYVRETADGSGEFQENRAFLTLAYYWGERDATALGGFR
ncbi:hypothetical protein JM946_15810 [Steroidobacter sp. S1-65]|uniref:TIGR03016 family PEP-CTERM system-associated outer membrane protein n=1 Tax=Steroidobacter gossypii TaxID=2805490 RepID=A0ABS1WZ01_9GAMM|nr:hypothetical protein [Steroidobacter gossypii]MBM0106198.1 hypothetical protein [Steroidobacter gossypii]